MFCDPGSGPWVQNRTEPFCTEVYFLIPSVLNRSEPFWTVREFITWLLQGRTVQNRSALILCFFDCSGLNRSEPFCTDYVTTTLVWLLKLLLLSKIWIWCVAGDAFAKDLSLQSVFCLIKNCFVEQLM